MKMILCGALGGVIVLIAVLAVHVNNTYREDLYLKTKAEVCARNYGVTNRPAYCG